MNLKGTIRIETDRRKPTAYCFLDAQGIAINESLIAAGDAFYSLYGIGQETLDVCMNIFNGMSYLGILEGTFENEFCHLKNLQKLIKNNSFPQDWKNESTLKGGSGFAVKHTIRRRFPKPADKTFNASFRPQMLVTNETSYHPYRPISWKLQSHQHPGLKTSLLHAHLHMSYPPDDEDECNNAVADTKISARE